MKSKVEQGNTWCVTCPCCNNHPQSRTVLDNLVGRIGESGTMGIYLAVGVIGGLIAGTIASTRGLSFFGYFILGFLLPVIGILVAALSTPRDRGQQGWWPDPMGRYEHRYYDGRAWTQHVSNGGNLLQDSEPCRLTDAGPTATHAGH